MDVLIGADSTGSAKFAFTGVNTGGTPTASISGATNIATFIDGNGNISSTNRNDLTLGNSSTYDKTGNILLNPNGIGYVGIGTNTPGELLSLGLAGTTKGVISLAGNTSGKVIVQPAAAAGNWSFTLPTDAGTSNTVLTTDGSGITSWQPIPTASILTYYFQSTASDVLTYRKQLISPYSPKTTLATAGLASGNTVLGNWITAPGSPGLTSIPAGSYDFHVHSAKVAGTKTAQVYAEIWEANSSGVDIALIGTTESSPVLTGSEGEYDLHLITSNTYTLASQNSRIVTRVYAAVSGLGTAPTVDLYYGGTADTHTALPSQTIDASNFVPYVGATANVDLGTHNLSATDLTATSNLSVGGTATISGTLTVGNGATNVIQSPYGPLVLNYKSGANTWTPGITLADITGDVTIAADLAVNGGDITSSGGLNITPTGALVAGVTGQTTTLQGSTTSITSNGAGNDITLTSADQIILNPVTSVELQNNTNITGDLTTSGTASISGNLTLGYGSALQSAYGPLTLNYKSGGDAWSPSIVIHDVSGNIDLAGGFGDSGCTIDNTLGTITCSAGISATSISFANITTGINTTATMTVDTGATLTYSGTGVVNASQLQGATWDSPLAIGTGVAAAGTFTDLTSDNLLVNQYATISASLALGSSTAAPGPGNLDMSGNLLADGTITGTTIYQGVNQVCDAGGSVPGCNIVNYWGQALGALYPINNTVDALNWRRFY